MLRQPTASSSEPDLACSLTVSVDWREGVVVLRGELDRNTAHHLGDALTALADAGHACWVVDAAEVTFCDAGGLRALAIGRALAVRSGRQLRLVRPSRCVDRLVTLSGLDRLLADSVPPAVPPVQRLPPSAADIRRRTSPVAAGRPSYVPA